jgi:hypothetical protein
MKLKLILPVVALASGIAFAVSPEPLAPLVCSGVTTSTVAVTATMPQATSAYIDAIQIKVSPAATTCTVTVATAGLGGLDARTIYSSATANGTITIRPVAQDSTNGVNVASFSKLFIAMDKLTVSASTATTVTNLTVTVVPVIERNP